MSKLDLLQFFDKNNYLYTLHEHQAIFTVEQGQHLRGNMPGCHSKNLFLKDREDGFFLISILQHKRLDIKAFCKMFNIAKVSFADERALLEILHLTPGSVTPF